MTQRRLHSLFEALFNTLLGFWISVAVGLVVYPWFGWQPRLLDVTGLTAIFTLVSILRGYVVRRLFNWMHGRGWR